MTSKIMEGIKRLFYGSQIPRDLALPMNTQNTGNTLGQGAVEHPPLDMLKAQGPPHQTLALAQQ